MTKNKQAALIPVEHIAQSILILRGQRVLLDSELAVLYDVTTNRFKEQVKRNLARFPTDFMLHAPCSMLSKHESGTASICPTPSPNMAPSWLRRILNSSRAVEMSSIISAVRLTVT